MEMIERTEGLALEELEAQHTALLPDRIEMRRRRRRRGFSGNRCPMVAIGQDNALAANAFNDCNFANVRL